MRLISRQRARLLSGIVVIVRLCQLLLEGSDRRLDLVVLLLQSRKRGLSILQVRTPPVHETVGWCLRRSASLQAVARVPEPEPAPLRLLLAAAQCTLTFASELLLERLDLNLHLLNLGASLLQSLFTLGRQLFLKLTHLGLQPFDFAAFAVSRALSRSLTNCSSSVLT